MIMTSLPRKVALAPDRDDHDDAQAEAVGHDEGSPPDSTIDAAVVGPEDVRGSGAEGGHADTEGTTGTIVDDIADAGSDPVVVAEGDDADTEGTNAEVWDPATEPPATDVSADPMPGSSGGGVGPADGPADDPATPDVIAAPDVIAPDPFAKPEDIVAAEAVDPAAVGFDGRSPVEATDEAGPDEIGDVSPPAASAPRSRTKAVAALTVLSLVVVGAGVGGLIWSRNSEKQATRPPTTQAAPTSPTLSDGAFVTFKDSEAGFSIRYPRGWTRSQAPVAEIRLLVSDGKQFSALVRVTRTDVVTTPANLANVKAVTDGLVGPGAQILKQDPITVNDLIGYRYIYTLTDKDSGLTTAHLHYFLFQGHKMNSIVFEALPSETFPRIEGVFDQMLGSFHSDPEPP